MNKCQRIFQGVLLAMMYALATAAHCASEKETDAQRDGFSGPVKSVSITEHRTGLKLEGDEASVVFWLGCRGAECEYDKDGHLTRFGEIANSEFHGQTTLYVRDASGAVVEEIRVNEKGEPAYRILVNQFGPTEEMNLVNGHWQTALLNSYDTKGNLVESQSFDTHGALSVRRDMVYDDTGLVIEEWDRGPENQFFHLVHTYDRRTKFETWTSFHEDGSVGLTFTLLDSKVLSYWQTPGSKAEFGSAFSMDTGPRKRESRSYNNDGSFKRIESTFLDDHKRNPSRIESYDGANELKAAADYQYEFDTFGNWVKRTVEVWTPSSAQSEIYEVDSRTIIYW